MHATNVVITKRDFERLNDLVQSPDSRFYGPMTGLENGLRQSRIIAPTKVANDVVTMNSKVEVRDLDSRQRETHTLVYPADADIEEGRLSVLAPLGAVLLGAKARQIVKCTTPRGIRRLMIERVLYQPEAAGDLHL